MANRFVLSWTSLQGACLFRAFSDQLVGSEAEHEEYRERCVDFMEKNKADFEPFVEEEFSEYCAKMRKRETWGGHVEAQALGRHLGVNVLVHQPALTRPL